MNRLGAAALVIAILAGCEWPAAAPSSTPTLPPASSSAASPSMSITPSAPPASVPVPTAPPRAPVDLSPNAKWEAIGALEEGWLAGLLVFDGRYVGHGSDAQGLPWVWTSPTGEEWDGTRLGRMIEPCPGDAMDYDSQVYRGATNGRRIVLVGLEYATDAPTCGSHRAASWASDDVLAWQRGDGFGGDVSFAEAQGVWAIPGGWEALVSTAPDDPRTIWRSADGLTWSMVETLPISDPLDAAISSAADGTRLMVITNYADGSADEILGVRGGESRLQWSSDGATWQDVAFDFNTAGPTRLQVAVDRAPTTGDAWVIFGERGEGDSADVWRSSDLVHWEHGSFPRPVVANLTWTRYGYLATGSDIYCGDGGGECPSDPTHQYRSQDGLDWTRLPVDIEADLFVDGPGGVLAVDGDSRVWKLE